MGPKAQSGLSCPHSDFSLRISYKTGSPGPFKSDVREEGCVGASGGLELLILMIIDQ